MNSDTDTEIVGEWVEEVLKRECEAGGRAEMVVKGRNGGQGERQLVPGGEAPKGEQIAGSDEGGEETSGSETMSDRSI
jgi:hypothetical protein